MAVATQIGDGLSLDMQRSEMALWGGAAALVVAAHLTAAWWFSQQPPPNPAPAQAAMAVMLELAPVAIAPEAVPTEEVAELVDSMAAEPVDDPVETVEPVEEPTPVEEVVEEIQPVEEPEIAEEVAELEPLEEVIPDIVEVPLPEIAVAIPEAKPVRQKPKPVEKPVKKAVEKPRERKPAPPEAVAAKKSAQDAPTTAAPRARQGSSGSGMSPATWASRVHAKINRSKRPGAGRGSVGIRFVVGTSGDLSGVSVARSSGDPGLDQAAIETVRRASPVPAPPPSVGAPKSTTVLITFR
ncbi:MAG: energy transducer TonB [Rhizobiaceae bacterium]